MLFRYLIMFLTIFSFVAPVFCMNKGVETYTVTKNNKTLKTTVEKLGKPQIFDIKQLEGLRSKKRLMAFLGSDIIDIQSYDTLQSKALAALLQALLVKIKTSNDENSSALISIDLRSFGKFLHAHDPAVDVLKKAIFANHSYISKKENNSSESFTVQKVPFFEPTVLPNNSINKIVKQTLYVKNPNIASSEQILVTEDYAFNKYEHLKTFNRIKEALLSLQTITLNNKTGLFIDLSSLRKAILDGDPIIKQLREIQDLQENIIKNGITVDKMKKYHLLINPFLKQDSPLEPKDLAKAMPEVNSKALEEFTVSAISENTAKQPNKDFDVSGYKEIVINKLNKLAVEIPKKNISLPTKRPTLATPLANPKDVPVQTQNEKTVLQIQEAQQSIIKKAPLWEKFELYAAAGICAYLMILYQSKTDIKNVYNYLFPYSQK